MKKESSKEVSKTIKKIVKVNDWLGRLPMWVLVVMILATMTLSGIALSQYQLSGSTLSQVFTMKNLMMMCGATASMILVDFVSLVLAKTARLKKLNSEYMRLEFQVHNSKISDINKMASGKIYDAIKDIAAINAHSLEMYVGMLPTLIPFCMLLKREWEASPIGAIVTVVCTIAAVILVSVSDKITHFESIAKEYTGKLNGISVDNFLNIKTFKYLGKSDYAHKRQLAAQVESFGWYANPIKYFFMKSAFLVSGLPMLINIFINRNDLGAISFIIMTDFVIDRTIDKLLTIAQNRVERNAQISAIKSLEGNDTAPAKDMPSKLILKDVDFDYGEDSVKFHIDQLKFVKGQRYHVTGESGQGKSSLANLLVGSIYPTKGRVPKLKTFYVYQETEMLNDTLRNNMTFGDESISDEELIDLMKQLNLYDWFVDKQDGLDTIVGERGCKLSSGQKQRVNIIRAILRMREHNDEFIILDEITSNLDSKTEDVAIDLIDKECDGTLMVISHHGGFDKICNNHIHVEDHQFYQDLNKHIINVNRKAQ